MAHFGKILPGGGKVKCPRKENIRAGQHADRIVF